MVILVGIAGISINVGKDKAEQWDRETSFVVKTSIGNHGVLRDEYRKGSVTSQVVLNLILMILIFLGSIVLRYFQQKVISDIDEKNLTPSDFGVMVTGLPLNKTQEEVEEWFKGHFEDLEVVYVNY